jgi:hypothetical protein
MLRFEASMLRFEPSMLHFEASMLGFESSTVECPNRKATPSNIGRAQL